jgi:hypothetical protein
MTSGSDGDAIWKEAIGEGLSRRRASACPVLEPALQDGRAGAAMGRHWIGDGPVMGLNLGVLIADFPKLDRRLATGEQ